MHNQSKAVRVSTRLSQLETDRIARHAKRAGTPYPEMVAILIRRGIAAFDSNNNEAQEQSINAATKQ